jgi:uncharacterized protein YbjT (DUF2867 family)
VEKGVAVLGSSSFVGRYLLSLLNKADYQVVAFSRSAKLQTTHVEWRQLPINSDVSLTRPNEIITTLKVGAGGVATSGTDHRRWKQGGTWKHHIIDPRSSNSAESDLLRVTVIATGF